jgi:two-component system chemotaxis response regulator CheB
MAKIRVLVVDDSVVVRRLLSDVLGSDPALEVVGTASSGRLALIKVTQVNPDLMVMDVEMPEMDGLQTLAALRKTHPRLPVVMFSSATQHGATATLDALALGANDYVNKPVGESGISLDQVKERLREELIPKIKGLCPQIAGKVPLPAMPRGARPSSLHLSTPRPAFDPLARNGRIDVVAIGVSTGGPNALAAVLPAFPSDLPVPVVIVQHMPPMFTRMLAERLQTQSAISVREASAGETLIAGQAWLAPGDYHLEVARVNGAVQTRLQQGPPENSCRPAVDVLFRSVVAAYGGRVLAVVLTGMGQDGLRGCERIREAGGQILVQDEATSVVWGMPGFVAKAGLADQVLPLDRIGSEIVRRVSRGRSLSHRD